jgi:hypothetical protein
MREALTFLLGNSTVDARSLSTAGTPQTELQDASREENSSQILLSGKEPCFRREVHINRI